MEIKLTQAEILTECSELFFEAGLLLEQKALPERTKKKLQTFVDLLVKCYINGEKILFKDVRGKRVVYIREGRLVYSVNPLTLISVSIYFLKSIRKTVI